MFNASTILDSFTRATSHYSLGSAIGGVCGGRNDRRHVLPIGQRLATQRILSRTLAASPEGRAPHPHPDCTTHNTQDMSFRGTPRGGRGGGFGGGRGGNSNFTPRGGV